MIRYPCRSNLSSPELENGVRKTCVMAKHRERRETLAIQCSQSQGKANSPDNNSFPCFKLPGGIKTENPQNSSEWDTDDGHAFAIAKPHGA